MEKIIDIYEVMGVKQEDIQTGEALTLAWRRAVQKYHPDRVTALEERFPLRSRADLEEMAAEKTLFLNTIRDFVRELAESPAKKAEYDRRLLQQKQAEAPSARSKPSTPPPYQERGGSARSGASTNSTRERPSGNGSAGTGTQETDVIIDGSIRGAGFYNWGGKDIIITGSVSGAPIINARKLTILGSLSGHPTINVATTVTIHGSLSGAPSITAPGGYTVRGSDRTGGRKQRPGTTYGYTETINTGGGDFRAASGGKNSFVGAHSPEGSFYTDGTLSTHSDGTFSITRATRTQFRQDNIVLEVLGENIIRGKVRKGRVLLNGVPVPPNEEGIVDLSKIDSPIAEQFKPKDRGPSPMSW